MPTNDSRRSEGSKPSPMDTVVRKSSRNRIATQPQNTSSQITCNLQRKKL